MRLAFLATHEKYFSMASQMIDSARSVMPGIKIVHLANHDCPKHPQADEIRRTPEGMEFGMMRMWHFSRLDGEWISADVDLKFLTDVWHVFDDEFDMAAATRAGTKWEKSMYAEVMPFNNGVLWSRSKDFWRDQLKMYPSLPESWRKWGEQMLFNNLFQSGRYRTKVLPCTYNYPPADGPEDLSQVHVLHFKGRRKVMMEA